MNFKKNIQPYLPGILIVLVAIIIGMATYQDYGMAWDEPDHRMIGNVNYDYAVHNREKAFHDFSIKEYGAGFEMMLIIIERRMHLCDSLRDIMFMRHMVTHLFFLMSIFFGYLLFLRLFKNQFMAVLGLLMLLLYPPIYAHSYFNTKDMPVLCMFLISFYYCHAAFSSGKPWLFLMLGISCGFMTGIRVMGILLTLISLFFIIADIIAVTARREKPQKLLLGALLFIVGFFVTIYISWPFLWGHPFDNFIAAYNRMAHYGWNSKVLLNGKPERALDLPKSYFPIYFLITNPELWIITAAGGIVLLAIGAVRKPIAFFRNTRERNFMIYLATFAIPIFAVIYLHSVLYDGWRHLYFIYPSFVLLALYCIDKLWQSRYKLVAASLCGIQIVYLVYFMIAYHPLQQTYFNHFVSHKPEYIRTHYDFEYWGASYLQALNYLLAKHPYDKIKICYGAGGQPMLNNITALQPHDRDRFEVIDDCTQADYFLTNYRWHPEDYPNKVEFKITVLNSTAVCIYKAR